MTGEGGRQGGTDSSVRLNFILSNDSFYSILLHLQVGVNITLPLHADGRMGGEKKANLKQITILHMDEGSLHLPGHSRTHHR